MCDDLLNPNGVVHGGVIFTMVDTSMGAAALSVIDDTKICASIDINVQFLRPVTSGEIIVETKVLRAGRRIVHMSSVATTAADEAPAATAAGAFAVLEQG